MYSHAHYYLLIDTFVYISRISHTNIFGLFLLYEAKQNWKLVCQHDFPCSRAQVTQIPTVSLLTSPQTSLKQKSRSLHSVQNPLRLHEAARHPLRLVVWRLGTSQVSFRVKRLCGRVLSILSLFFIRPSSFFSPLSVVRLTQIFGIFKKNKKGNNVLKPFFTWNNSFNLKNEHSNTIEKNRNIFTGAQPKAGIGLKMQTVSLSFFERYIVWDISLAHWNLIRHFEKHEAWRTQLRTVKGKIIAFWGTTRSPTLTMH